MKEEPTIQEIIDDEENRIKRIAALVDAGDSILDKYGIKVKMLEIWNNRCTSCHDADKGIDLTELLLAFVEGEVMTKITADELKQVFVGTCVNSFVEGMKRLKNMEAMRQVMSSMGLGAPQQEPEETEDNN